MTIEKALLVGHVNAHRPGCSNDAERRTLSTALARRRGRFAFPDDFAEGVGRIVDHVVAKHGKESALGKFLGGIVDVRANCGDWEAERPDVELLFVFPTIDDVPPDAGDHVDALLKRFRPTGRFGTPTGRISTLETMSAATHLSSDALELEYVSRRRRPR